MENIFEENVETVETPETAQPDFAQTMDNPFAQEIPEAPASPVDQAINKVKKVPKVIWIAAVAAVVAIVAAILIIGAVTNTYKTPLDLQYKVMNAKDFSHPMEKTLALCNGFCEDELSDFVAIYKKTDMYEDMEDRLEEAFEEQIEYYEDEYGKDYKFYYEIDDEDELDSDDLEEVEDDIKNMAKSMKSAIKEMDDYDSDDWEDMADSLGISKSEAKEFAKVIKALYEELKSVKVTEGYELEIVEMVSGEELGDPEEVREYTVYVYKVNGRWISSSIFSAFTSIF